MMPIHQLFRELGFSKT